MGGKLLTAWVHGGSAIATVRDSAASRSEGCAEWLSGPFLGSKPPEQGLLAGCEGPSAARPSPTVFHDKTRPGRQYAARAVMAGQEFSRCGGRSSPDLFR